MYGMGVYPRKILKTEWSGMNFDAFKIHIRSLGLQLF